LGICGGTRETLIHLILETKKTGEGELNIEGLYSGTQIPEKAYEKGLGDMQTKRNKKEKLEASGFFARGGSTPDQKRSEQVR